MDPSLQREISFGIQAYYLLFVGGPERIPFSFTHELAFEYAVGRICLDSAEDYAAYARSLIAYETAQSLEQSREAVFFATEHDGDRATEYSARFLVEPLLDNVRKTKKWSVEPLLGGCATKVALIERLRSSPPALLFTATHGLGWQSGHPREEQGALVCQEWPGFGKMQPEAYLAGHDIPRDAALRGTVAFLYACFSAGTPNEDQYFHGTGQLGPRTAHKPYISALPKALLAHPSGGALAVVGHVAPSLASSFMPDGSWAKPDTYAQAVERVLSHLPLGVALRNFRDRYAAFSITIASLARAAEARARVSSLELASFWSQRNDAEGFVLLGDPAARLRAGSLS